MDDYSFLRDALETWRATSDWVKAVAILVVPGAVLIHQVLHHRAEQRAMIAQERDALNDARVRELVEAQMCRIVAEWERARLAEEQMRRIGDGR